VISSQTQRQPVSPTERTSAWKRAATPEQILRSFNTRAFKRENPDKPELMLEFVAQAHARGAPISFVQYWGKGLRQTLAAPEFTCLDFLSSMLSRIREIYEPGADFTLLFTDTHAALNGHSQASILSYFQDLLRATRPHRFNVCLLSSLINAPGLRPDETVESQVPTPEVLAELRASAAKWFKGEGSVEEGAVRYFHANMVERKVVERAFPRSIFVTFNGSHVKWLFPDALPIYYMYSIRRGTSDKPWFLPPDYTSRNPGLNGQPRELFRPAAETPKG
jgi:L-tyrosine isonitrile synthase